MSLVLVGEGYTTVGLRSERTGFIAATRTGTGAWYCAGCQAALVGGVAHSCAGLQDLMGEAFKMSPDEWTLPPDARPLVVREDHDPGDEDWS